MKLNTKLRWHTACRASKRRVQNEPASLKEVSRSVTARLAKAARKAGKGGKKRDVDAGYETLSEGSTGGAHSQACVLAKGGNDAVLHPAPLQPFTAAGAFAILVILKHKKFIEGQQQDCELMYLLRSSSVCKQALQCAQLPSSWRA